MNPNDTAERVDVLIAGAGPTGLSAALALAPLGLRVVLVDPQDAAQLADPPPDGRELALTHRTEALLRRWGLWDRLPDGARAPLQAASVSTGGAQAALRLDASHGWRGLPARPGWLPASVPWLPDGMAGAPAGAGPVPPDASLVHLGTLVSQHALRRALWEGCAAQPGVRVLAGHRLEAMHRDDEGVTVRLAGPGGEARALRASLLVAADGRLSAVRRMAGMAADLHDFGRSAIVCRMRHERAHQQVAHEAFHHGHTLAVLPLADAPDDGAGPRHRASFVVTAPSELAQRWMALSAADYAATVEPWLDGQLGRLRPGPGDESRRHLYPLVATWAPRLVSRRVALVGDAAVGMHPVTAHGFNLGLYGAETLARQIGRRARGGRVDPADPRALDAYDREHRDTARWIFHGTNAIVRLFTDDRPAARLARQATLHLAERLPPVKALIVRQLVDA